MGAPGPGPGPEQTQRWRRDYSADGGLPFDPDQLERRLVWIFGSPRTGSTWLLRMLCDPVRIAADLPLGFGPPPGEPAPLPAVPFDEFLIAHHIAPVAGEPADLDGTIVPTTADVYMGDRTSYALAKAYAPIWRPELRRLILVRIAAALDAAEQAGTPAATRAPVVIKEVNGSHAADRVMALFPRSRLLFLVRDGRDVIDSRIHARGPGGWATGRGGPAFETPAERLEWVRRECREWAALTEMTRIAYAAHPEELRRMVRYEDLRRDTVATLTELRGWLGLDADPDRVAAIASAHDFDSLPAERRGPTKPARAAAPGLWRESLTAAEQDVANEIIGPRLGALGYAAD